MNFINSLIHYSLHNRVVVLFAAVVIMVAGLHSAFKVDVDVFPDLNAPTVVVMTEANGMATEEVEQLVTFPIETAVNGATGVRRVRSSSSTGFSVVWVEFDWGTDIYIARQIVSEKLAMTSESLPEQAGTPTLAPQSSLLGEMLIVGLTTIDGMENEKTKNENEYSQQFNNPTTTNNAPATSMLHLRTIADWTIRPRLLSVGGVAQVAVIGGDIKEYQILLDPERMKHYDVSLDDVLTATQGMNRNTNGGTIYEYGNEYIVRGMLSTSNVEELSKNVVKVVNDSPILLGDIANVQIGAKAPKLGTASERANNAVLLTVTKQPSTSTIELTAKLEDALKDLQKNLPPGIHISTDVYRQSRFIDSSISNVQHSLIEGGIFVIIILFLFLANVRTTVISVLSIPISLLFTILALHTFGLTINTMSLGGMAIAIGSLVDDAIVDVENVYKRLRENRLKSHAERKSVIDVVFDASREVRMPVLNSTLIIVVSFVPLFFLSGMEGRMLVPLGISFIVALFASTIVALTLTPVLCSFLLGNKNDKEMKDSFIAVWLRKYYSKALRWTLEHKRIVVGSTAALFVVALIGFFTLGHSFLPAFNEGSFTINVSSLPGISLEESDNLGHRAEEILLSVPEIKTVARKTGRAELDEHSLGVNVSEIEAPFELDKRSRKEVIAEVREKLSVIDGVNIEIGQPITHRIAHMLSGTESDIAIKLFGDDLNKMFTLGNKIKSLIKDVPGLVDVNVEQQVERPELKIIPKRDILAKYGIPLSEFSEYVRVCLAGEICSSVYEDGKSFDLTVKVRDDYRDEAEKIRDLVVNYGSRKIPLGYLADIVSANGPNTINRENVQRKIVISANVGSGDLRGIVNEIRKRIDENVTLPEDYHVEYGGQFESEQSASRTLLLMSLLSIIVIFMLLFHEFKDAKQSCVVLLNLPLALIGGVFCLLITTGEVSIPAIIGFISLFGIATRNGMLLINRYNTLTQNGMPLHEAVLQGSLDRLNPILMTALTSALAMIPLAINGDLSGNEIQSPMAKVILGGLLSSTLLNGFIVPIMYLVMKNGRMDNK